MPRTGQPYAQSTTARARLVLRGGLTSLTAVEDWQAWQATSHQSDDATSTMQHEQEALLRARFLIARGEITEALHLLGNWQIDARTWRRLRSELDIQVLLSLAYAAGSRSAEAGHALKEALILAVHRADVAVFARR